MKEYIFVLAYKIEFGNAEIWYQGQNERKREKKCLIVTKQRKKDEVKSILIQNKNS